MKFLPDQDGGNGGGTMRNACESQKGIQCKFNIWMTVRRGGNYPEKIH